MAAVAVCAAVLIAALYVWMVILPLRAPTSAQEMADSWLEHVENGGERSADLKLVHASQEKVRILCTEVGDIA